MICAQMMEKISIMSILRQSKKQHPKDPTCSVNSAAETK